jgi:RNA polymerase sigma factor (sigma-70 family)
VLHHLNMPPPAEGFASRLFLGPALRTQPDRRLVTLVREGYEAAFEEIVRRYGKPLGRYAASIVGGHSEDVLQDAFAKAVPALRRDDAEIDLRPWLFRIVRNTALNDLRDNPPSPEVLAEALAGGRNPADELERREELADLIKRLQALPEAQRAAIVMRELEGLGHDEIASALGLTGGGARQAIYRARRTLRDGAGLLLPLPLLRLLIDHCADAAGAAAGTGGAIAAAGASAGGVGGAAKLGVVAVVLVGSVGAGVAVQDRGGDGEARAVESATRGAAAVAPALGPPVAAATTVADGGGSGSDKREQGSESEHRASDDRGHGSDSDDEKLRGKRSGERRHDRRGRSPHGPPRRGDGVRGPRGGDRGDPGGGAQGGRSGPRLGGRDSDRRSGHNGPGDGSNRSGAGDQVPPRDHGSTPTPPPAAVETPESNQPDRPDEIEAPPDEDVRDLRP